MDKIRTLTEDNTALVRSYQVHTEDKIILETTLKKLKE